MDNIVTRIIKTVYERIAALGDLFKKRNKEYGDDYKHHGYVMMGYLPNGITLTTASDFNRYAIYMMMVAKMGRYGKNFDLGGHEDSLNDIAVYAMMLAELDDRERL